MKTIAEIKEAQQARQSALFKELGIFFAFGTKQFDEQKEEGVVYVAGPAGMLIPQKNMKAFLQKYEQLQKENQAEFQRYIEMDKYIQYQLANHEAYYTWSIDEAFSAVKEAYPHCTEEDMRRVFDLHKNS